MEQQAQQAQQAQQQPGLNGGVEGQETPPLLELLRASGPLPGTPPSSSDDGDDSPAAPGASHHSRQTVELLYALNGRRPGDSPLPKDSKAAAAAGASTGATGGDRRRWGGRLPFFGRSGSGAGKQAGGAEANGGSGAGGKASDSSSSAGSSKASEVEASGDSSSRGGAGRSGQGAAAEGSSAPTPDLGGAAAPAAAAGKPLKQKHGSWFGSLFSGSKVKSQDAAGGNEGAGASDGGPASSAAAPIMGGLPLTPLGDEENEDAGPGQQQQTQQQMQQTQTQRQNGSSKGRGELSSPESLGLGATVTPDPSEAGSRAPSPATVGLLSAAAAAGPGAAAGDAAAPEAAAPGGKKSHHKRHRSLTSIISQGLGLSKGGRRRHSSSGNAEELAGEPSPALESSSSAELAGRPISAKGASPPAEPSVSGKASGSPALSCFGLGVRQATVGDEEAATPAASPAAASLLPLDPGFGLEVDDGPILPLSEMGIRNVGNTCFLSAALQCLRHTPHLPLLLVPDLLEQWVQQEAVAAGAAAAGEEPSRSGSSGAEQAPDPQQQQEQEQQEEQQPSSEGSAAEAEILPVQQRQQQQHEQGEERLASSSAGEAPAAAADASAAAAAAAAGVASGGEPPGARAGATAQAAGELLGAAGAPGSDTVPGTAAAAGAAAAGEAGAAAAAAAPALEATVSPEAAAEKLRQASASSAPEVGQSSEASPDAAAPPREPEGSGEGAAVVAAAAEGPPALAPAAAAAGQETAAEGAEPQQPQQQLAVQAVAAAAAAPARPQRPERGALLAAFAGLVRDLYTKNGVVSVDPNVLLCLLRGFPTAADFFDGGQHDCQEVLRALLDLLHEDLNRVPRPPPPPPAPELEGQPGGSTQQGEAEKADRHWAAYLMRDSSPITDLFSGQLQSSVSCHGCGRRFTMYEPFWDLSLPLAKEGKNSSLSWLGIKGTPASIQDCLRVFTADELLEGEEAYHCEVCKDKTSATKHLRIHRFPDVLVLHIKRFKYKGSNTDKLSANVSFPLRELCLHQFASPESPAAPADCVYDLFAVSNHFGTLGGGHYTAMCRVPLGGGREAWYSYNDEIVQRIAAQQAISQHAYILFYARRKLKPKGGSPQNSTHHHHRSSSSGDRT